MVFFAARFGGKTECAGTLILRTGTVGDDLHLVDRFDWSGIGNRSVITLLVRSGWNTVEIDLGEISAIACRDARKESRKALAAR